MDLSDEQVRRIVNEVLNGLCVDENARISHMFQVVIRERVLEAFEKAWSEPFFPTNIYGERVGKEATTIRGLVMDSAVAILDRQVPGGHSLDRKQSVLSKLIADEVGSAFAGEVKGAIDAAKKDAVSAVREKAADVLAGTIAKMQGVTLR